MFKDKMFTIQENISRHIFLFEDMYDFQMNDSYNDSVDYCQVMGFPEMCNPLFPYLQTLNMVYIPIVIVVGFIGNILSFLVLSTTHLKLRSSSYYLAALAVSDFGFLVVVFVVYCSFNEIFELFNKEGFCQLFIYLSSVCACLSVWLTVAFTTERFIAVRYPLKCQSICTVSRAKVIVFSIACAALLSQVHLLWMAGLITHEGKMECDMQPHYILLGNIINCLDTFFTFIIPVILIIVMNISIARVVFKSQNPVTHDDGRFLSERVRFHLSSQSSDSTRNSEQEYSSSFRRVKYVGRYLKCTRHTRTSLQAQQNINKMLLVISSVFIALNFPSYILRISAYFGFTVRKRSQADFIWGAQQFAMLLYYTNFSINFLLYSMCGKSFRVCLKNMFREMFRKLTT